MSVTSMDASPSGSELRPPTSWQRLHPGWIHTNDLEINVSQFAKPLSPDSFLLFIHVIECFSLKHHPHESLVAEEKGRGRCWPFTVE